VVDLNRRLGLPGGLAEMGVTRAMLRRVAEHAAQDPSTETNPRPAGADDYESLLRDALGP
jgi:alcohol dehydrogenase class IV